MQGHEYRSEFARNYYNQGRDQGREEGVRAALLVLARTRLATVTAEDEAAIDALHDERALTELIGVLGVGTPSEARAAFDLVVRSLRGG